VQNAHRALPGYILVGAIIGGAAVRNKRKTRSLDGIPTDPSRKREKSGPGERTERIDIAETPKQCFNPKME